MCPSYLRMQWPEYIYSNCFIDAPWWWLRNLDRAQQDGLSPLCHVWGSAGKMWMAAGDSKSWRPKSTGSFLTHMPGTRAQLGPSPKPWHVDPGGWVQEEASRERTFQKNQRKSCPAFPDPGSEVTKHLLLYWSKQVQACPDSREEAPHPTSQGNSVKEVEVISYKAISKLHLIDNFPNLSCLKNENTFLLRLSSGRESKNEPTKGYGFFMFHLYGVSIYFSMSALEAYLKVAEYLKALFLMGWPYSNGTWWSRP